MSSLSLDQEETTTRMLSTTFGYAAGDVDVVRSVNCWYTVYCGITNLCFLLVDVGPRSSGGQGQRNAAKFAGL
jgi:hypothetical protein